MAACMESLINSIGELEGKIGYTFNNKNNIVLALTHSSYANENRSEKIESNERLEFLGDAVLNVVISEEIFTKHPELTEGEMTKTRANIVCESSLMKCSAKLDVGKYLLLGKGEELTGGRERVSILADAFEALIGSVYMDGGIKKAKSFIFDNMRVLIDRAVRGNLQIDYKTQLQEVVQKKGDSKITYHIISEKGPDHNKIFVTQVKVDDRILGTGEGKSKKESEQNAAHVALAKVST